MNALSRRRFLGGSAALAGAALTGGALSSCGTGQTISADPNELVLWYWLRSIAPSFLEQAAQEIPGTGKRLRADAIGGTFDSKLRTSLAGGSYIPDITGINSNCSLYFPNEDQFVDLNELGAAEFKDDFYDWKWSLGTTPTGRFCFWPMDIGPTGFFYRSDVFAEAGLPSEPEEVSAAISTWPAWIEFGTKLRKDADAAMIATATMLFQRFLDASPERYFDANNVPLFEADGSAVRKAWDTAVDSIKAGLTGNNQTGNDQNAAWVSGKTAGNISAAWWMNVLADTAPDTAGKWRLAAQPEKPGNFGGSFLTIPRSCKDPEAAFAFMSWLTSPENQATSYNEVQLFPSSPLSFESGAMKGGGDFYGPQDPLEFFVKAAQEVPTTFVSTYESQVSAFTVELANVETAGKDPERAWDEAVAEVNRVLKKRGVI